jgi:hypothetical protein
VVEEEGGERDVEARIRVWKRRRPPLVEPDLEARVGRPPACLGEDRGVGVQPGHRDAGRGARRRDRERARSAPHVQHLLAAGERSVFDHAALDRPVAHHHGGHGIEQRGEAVEAERGDELVSVGHLSGRAGA